MGAEKNLRKSARNKSALICEKKNRQVHVDSRRLKSADDRIRNSKFVTCNSFSTSHFSISC